MISLLLLFAAFLLFVFATLRAPSPRINLLAAGLACWSLSVILTSARL